ncbi:uncharacterized protein RSE6_04447 [Rhynchosporium secalis]|uniref:Uncharacterized protein n=1 Tax=Rhynchosporium secalis TaxID=38038 RepID=A0A1E1M5B1_RHYSE|nr:uncharacterized protein RSE6_04447 [Rhynchosporium secalis]
MKILSVFLSSIAVTHAAYRVICGATGSAKIGDVEWAVYNRRSALALNGKGFWGVKRQTCEYPGYGSAEVVSLCRSDPYSSQHSTGLQNGGVSCASIDKAALRCTNYC